MSENNELKVNGGYPLHTFEQVEEVYMVYISSVEDRKNIRDAYNFILDKHKDQYRKSGEPYYHHLVEVAYILATLQVGPSTIIAGLLHDVVEDTDVSVKEIEERWGSDVAKIVDSLTKIQRLKLSKIDKSEFEAEDHRKIFIGMAKDIRVIIIKLADRLHNLRTLGALKPERQIALSNETLEVFVPIAHRLGLEVIKSEMADLCLKYLHPEEYEEINTQLLKKSKALKRSLEAIKKRIADALFERNIKFEISSRVKSIYSIYEKTHKKGHTFNDIYDLLALRIITDNEVRCYEILGIIHQMYKPLPGRFKDYIGMPKPNLYQSLHTTIISGDGNVYEIQIRTEEMDKMAETGVASHWAYKEGSGYNPKEEQKEIENKLHWFRDFVSLSANSNKDIGTATEYMESLTKDIFEANVYVFTPKGRVIELPSGSCPIDFAYHIHSKVGDTTVGAIVNGTMVPLNTVLVTGDVVEIKTRKDAPGPNDDWLEMARSNMAKTSIRKFIQKKNADLVREDKIAKGKQSCLDSFLDREINEEGMMKYLENEQLLEYFKFKTVDDLFIGVSGRKPTPGAIIEYLKIKKPISMPTKIVSAKSSNGKYICPVECKGATGIAISLAKCCTPIPGDEIIGYITKGKGITVHRKECPNVANENERLVDVYWRDDIQYGTYPVDILIMANDRPNLLLHVASALSNNHISATNLHASTSDNGTTCLINISLLVPDAKRLHDLKNILLNIAGVYEVTRVIH